eukprot:3311657-Prymnesium_polylepis.1
MPLRHPCPRRRLQLLRHLRLRPRPRVTLQPSRDLRLHGRRPAAARPQLGDGRLQLGNVCAQ